jgi:phosphoglycerate dehydrogenase-like enzyme
VSSSKRPVIVVEDDPFTRLIQIVLDPDASAERTAAFADFMAHDEPDFAGWCERVRRQAHSLDPSDVRMVTTPEEMTAVLPEADALVVEAFRVGARELAAAPRLRVVQKFGATLRNIDTGACAARGIAVRTLRRRANVACAEQAFALMLALAKMLPRLAGLIGVEQMVTAGYPYRPYDLRYTPRSNFARVPGMRMLQGTTLGIVGLGEIGREIARRAAAFEMRILYHQRTRVDVSEEEALQAQYVPLHELMERSDWIVPQVPGGAATRGMIGPAELARVQAGACIVNVARADLVDRVALIDALRSGRLGGFALDPLYQEPGRSDDELLQFDNVILVPHMAGSPRTNGLADLEELMVGLASALAGSAATSLARSHN